VRAIECEAARVDHHSNRAESALMLRNILISERTLVAAEARSKTEIQTQGWQQRRRQWHSRGEGSSSGAGQSGSSGEGVSSSGSRGKDARPEEQCTMHI
jgi:hypothetical protein